jgi:hypothetical protein
MFLSTPHTHVYHNQTQQQKMSSTGSHTVITETREKIQTELDALMGILEDVQGIIPEGAYLRGMNALGALHRHKNTALTAIRPGAILRCWKTMEQIEEEDEELYDEIVDVADNIVVEVCGEDTSIYSDERYNLVHRGQEQETFQALLNYKPQEGNAGYETSPMVLHHAIQLIMERIFNDTYHELEIVRPVSCECGWRGAHGNWDRHIRNMRHQRWVTAECLKRFHSVSSVFVNPEFSNELVQLFVKSRRENGFIYIKQEDIRDSREFKQALEEIISECRDSLGEHVVFVSSTEHTTSWFA